MAEHKSAGRVVGECSFQQFVGGERGADGIGVVTEFPDLCRDLVHDAEHPIDHADASRSVVGVAGSGIDRGQHGGIVEVESVVVDEKVETGRVTATNLEAIDRRERLMDRKECFQRPCRAGCPGERRDSLRGTQPVTSDRPHTVANSDEFVIASLELGRGQQRVVFHCDLDRLDRSSDLAAVVGERRTDRLVLEQQTNPGDTAQ